MGPGRRPADYSGSEGWLSRLCNRTVAGASAGAVGGVLFAAVRGRPVLTYGVSIALNTTIATACFCGAHEIVRELRAAPPDDLANSFIGGLASGAALGRLQGGPQRALPAALLFAAVGTSIHVGARLLHEQKLRQLTEELASMDRASNALQVGGEGLQGAGSKEKPLFSELAFPDWFPLQRLTEEEAQKRAREKEAALNRQVESIHSGRR